MGSTNPRSPKITATPANVLSSENRYNLRDRSKKVDYSNHNNQLDSILQESVELNEQMEILQQQMNEMKAMEERLDKLQAKRLSTLPTEASPSHKVSPLVTSILSSASSGQSLPDAQNRTPGKSLVSSLVAPPSNATLKPVSFDITKRLEDDLDVEGIGPRPDQWQSSQRNVPHGSSKQWQAGIGKKHGLMKKDIREMAQRYTTMQKKNFTQPFVPVTPSGPDDLGPGEGMDNVLKFLHSGALTLSPQYVPSADTLKSTTPSESPPEIPSPRRGPPSNSRGVPDMPPPPPLMLPPPSRRMSAPQRSPQGHSSSQQTSQISPGARSIYVPSQPSRYIRADTRRSASPEISPPLSPPQRLRPAAARSSSPISPHDQASPTTVSPQKLSSENTDPFFSQREFTDATPIAPKTDDSRKDSAHRMSIGYVATLAERLGDADAAAQITSQWVDGAGGVGEERKKKVSFAGENEVIIIEDEDTEMEDVEGDDVDEDKGRNKDMDEAGYPGAWEEEM
ncbi:hypothetical protein N0V94_005663 [Neodidymelliopsis sp. IMI 364377]|nr:hypothetical protein N0V94_005663 [Neodidymelliopsis sp. IMI 364377]